MVVDDYTREGVLSYKLQDLRMMSWDRYCNWARVQGGGAAYDPLAKRTKADNCRIVQLTGLLCVRTRS